MYGGDHKPELTTERHGTARKVEIWAVLNVTPDSFSDGGRYLETGAAIARAKGMLAEGADVIDVGGASSRPRGKTYGAGAEDVPVEIEIARVVPVVEALANELGARVSVDTTRGAVASAALRAGARIVNDVSMGRDPALIAAAAAHGAALVLMHTRGDGSVAPPGTTYGDVVADVVRELGEAVERAVSAGVPRERVWTDPGLGFAKTAAQSAALLGATAALAALGRPVLVGASRKSFLSVLSPSAKTPDDRLAGSLAAAVIAADRGAAAVRVHDVAATRQALDVLVGVGDA